jgi:hypothetical protein
MCYVQVRNRASADGYAPALYMAKVLKMVRKLREGGKRIFAKQFIKSWQETLQKSFNQKKHRCWCKVPTLMCTCCSGEVKLVNDDKARLVDVWRQMWLG